MPKSGKKYRAALEKVDRARRYPVREAVEVLKSFRTAKFDETVEVHMALSIDPKKTDQAIRGSVSLPKGIGKTLRVICFAEGHAAEEATAAGAVKVGSGDLAKEIEGGYSDFDVCIAAPDMMRHVGKLGRILGPQGKMPTPKAGTVTPNVAQAVKEFAAGKIEFRNDATGNIHAPVGRKSFSVDDLSENVVSFIEHVKGMRPASAKGAFIKSATLTSTMGPGIRVEVLN
ncbi:MAG: 50S ribosomal protein L1 [Planctomycetes bacterium]|nr:50S ribosomal protein L1 [Planctomycetota bacterium]